MGRYVGSNEKRHLCPDGSIYIVWPNDHWTEFNTQHTRDIDPMMGQRLRPNIGSMSRGCWVVINNIHRGTDELTGVMTCDDITRKEMVNNMA